MLQDLSLSSFKVSFTDRLRIGPPPYLYIAVGPFPSGTRENKRGSTPHCVTQVAVVASGQVGRKGWPVHPYRAVVLAGQRATPLARLLSQQQSGWGLHVKPE